MARTSGLASSNASLPSPTRVTSLSSRYGLKRRSTSWNHAMAASSAASGTNGARTSIDTVVPMTCCARTWRAAARASPRTWSSDPGVVDRRLERLRICGARVRRPGDAVDVRALRLERLALELGRCPAADLLRPAVASRELERLDRGDRPPFHRDLDLHGAVAGVHHRPVDRPRAGLRRVRACAG